MDPSMKNNNGNKVQVYPEEETVCVRLQLKPQNPKEHMYWNSEFGKLDEIGNQNALCQLFKDPSKVEILKVENIKALKLSHNQIVNLRDIMKSECILHRACFGSPEVFEYLIRILKLYPKPLDKYKQTPMHFAAYKNKSNIIIYLMSIKEYYNGNELTEDLLTPAHYAAFSNSTEALETLNNFGCDMNKEDKKGWTPLALAIHFERTAAVKCLLDLNVKIDYITMLKLLHDFPKLAASVLYKKPFFKIDHEKDEVTYDFTILIPKNKTEESKYLPTPLAIVVKNKSLCIVESEVFQEYINIQWNEFGRKFALTQFFIYLGYVLVWTSLGIFKDYNTRNPYNLPGDSWRIILLIIAFVGIITEWILEWRQYQSSKNQTELMNMFYYYEQHLPKYKVFKEEQEEILSQEKKDQLSYFNQRWNLIDIASITMQVIDFVSQIILIFSNIGHAHNYIACANITLLWISLLKTLRPFKPTGTLVVSLSNVVGKDLIRFSIVFLMFLLPMSFNFWMTFGEKKIVSENLTASVDYYDSFTNVFFSVFRIAVVDEYDYDNMKKIEPIFTEILITLWIAMAAILLVNLFIALLTDTFQRVYDNTNITITLEKARYLMEAWDVMQKYEVFFKPSNKSEKKFLEKMESKYNIHVHSLEFMKPTKLYNILNNVQEYLSVHDRILEDSLHMKRVIKNILQAYNIGPTKETALDSQMFMLTRSSLPLYINIMRKDLQKLLQHIKDSQSEKLEASTSIS